MHSTQHPSKVQKPSASIQSCLLHTSNTLAENHIGAGMQEAAILLQYVTGLTLTELYCNLQRPLSPAEHSLLDSLLRRRSNHEPLQYITGSCGFYGREFNVDARALVPRPETELLVDAVVSHCEQVPEFRDHVRIADVCTGSGAIGITLACQLPASTVVALDISAEALSVAAINRKQHCVQQQVDLVQGDLLAAFQRGFDIVVSNPPYVETETIESLQPEVRCFEPRMALDGGVDGLQQMRILVHQARRVLVGGGVLIVEVGIGQSSAVMRLMRETGCWVDVTSIRDLQGIKRVVVGRYAGD